ncbi:MAG: hypothetical protein KDE03_09435 [Rhodobacteraceae bacterium]|nr:hypothetical protein [Paracoccaceae bacterium]
MKNPRSSKKPDRTPSVPGPDGKNETGKILLVDVGSGQAMKITGLTGADCVETRFADVTPALLGKHQPYAVVCRLFGGDHDALDLADRLAKIGYKGAILALSPHLPHAAQVRAEITAQCARKGLQFELIVEPVLP